jgi:Taurine catabolism dioxygenase TauD, TfdA family
MNPLRNTWTAESLKNDSRWRVNVPEDVQAEWRRLPSDEQELSALLANPLSFDASPEKWPATARWGARLRAELLEGRGFFCASDTSGASEPLLRLRYLLLARQLGSLNDRYGYLYDVYDQGYSYTRQAVPVSQTRAATGFHTDSTSINSFPDSVGLLCVRPARDGGESVLSSASLIYQRMKAHHPELAARLEEEIVREIITPGDAKSVELIRQNRFPVFCLGRYGQPFTFRYMRYWIETGHQKAELELDSRLLQALDKLDSLLESHEYVFRFRLERGDMFFINNHTLAHGRTDYEDFEEAHRRRLLVRTWVHFPAQA